MNTMTRPHPPALRKAAIVIATLDARSAEALLEKMPLDIAAQVREQMVELADIPAAEQEAVLREFMTAGDSLADTELAGVELDPSLADKLQSSSGYPEPPGDSKSKPFQFLHQATASLLARHLERQHPQVIAVVTAHLPPHQAADLLRQFQPKLQSEVLRRVAELDLADPEALRDIERELEALLHDELRLARNRQSGLTAVSTILNAAGAERNALLVNLSRHDFDLATQLTGPAAHNEAMRANADRPVVAAKSSPTAEPKGAPSKTHVDRRSAPPAFRPDRHATELPQPEVPFEELAQLADDDWAVLIRAAEPAIVLLALTGASDQLLQRITQRLSRRESQALRSRLRQTGPLRLSDIEQAQRHIAELASRLAARGQIRLLERRRFAAAA
jgi:flagellar motor switch protein FliG